jgi:Zn-dependent M28 family amino/carboxypeptidase
MAAAAAVAAAAPASAGAQRAADPQVAALVAGVSSDRLKALNDTLAGFMTRNTLSTDPASGIAAARQWILEELQRSSSRLEVSFDVHQIPEGGRITRPVELQNVMAVLPGRSARRIYISGHYDSLNLGEGRGNADVVAPGANDDGSGTVLTMELARVFAESGLQFDATLVFICLAGEEQGLVGARAHAAQAEAGNVVIDAVLNNDITGNSTGGDGTVDSATVRVFSQGPEDSLSRQLARYVRRVAGTYVPGHVIRLIARADRFGRGGDHTAFNEHGYAAVRISESKENYARQHSALDTSDGVDFAYLAKNARVNAAAAASLALAPPAPPVSGRAPEGAPRPGLSRGGGYDARLRWIASPGATRYRVVWREAWTPDWQHDVVVGDVTEHVLPNISIDDYVFGVAAIGPGGHESVVSAYVR